MAAVQYTDIPKNFLSEININTGDITKLTNREAIRESIHNLINTPLESIPFNRTRGTILNNILFENLNGLTISDIQDTIGDVISQYESRVRITGIDVTSEGSNLVSVEVQFNVPKFTDNLQSSGTLKSYFERF